MSIFNWADDCSAELAGLISQMNPLAGADILNPFRGDPDIDQVPLQLHIELLHQGQWYEQRLHVKPDSIRGKERAGLEVSTFQFTLQDIYSPSRITFRPGAVQGMKVRAHNGNNTEILFKGEVSEPPKPTAFFVKDDGSDKRYLTVSCTNELTLFRRIPIFEIGTWATEGAMLADLCSRHVPELDASGINPAVGRPIDQKTIEGEYLFELFNAALKNDPDLAFFLDISQEPSRIVFDHRSASEVLLPIELNDTNIYNYCRPGDHWIHSSAKTYRNRIRLRYPRLYAKGTVDVFQAVEGGAGEGGHIVYGTDTDWFENVFPGQRFRVAGSKSSYTVGDNYSNSAGTIEELYLSSPYREIDATGLAYEVIGDETEIVEDDVNEQVRRAALRGETGLNAGIVEVIIRENTPLTDEEAQRLAQGALRLDAYEGEFRTDNRKFLVPNLRAGRTLRHNMPQRNIVQDVPIQEIDWRVNQGVTESKAGRDDAYISYTLSFTNRDLLTENVILSLLLANRRSRVRDLETLTVHATLNERSVIHDCIKATQGELCENPSTMAVQVTAHDVSAVTGPWYPAPLGPGQQGFVPVDPADPGSYNFAT